MEMVKTQVNNLTAIGKVRASEGKNAVSLFLLYKEAYKAEISCLNIELAYQEAYSRSQENQLFEGIKEALAREGNFEDTHWFCSCFYHRP